MDAEALSSSSLGGNSIAPPTLIRPPVATQAAHQETALHANASPLESHLPATVTAKVVGATEPIAEDTFVDLKAIQLAIQGAPDEDSESVSGRISGEDGSESELCGSSDSSGCSSTDYSDAASDAHLSPGSRRARREEARLARQKELAVLDALKAKIAQATAEHKELQQLCAREDATMARMRQWMERAHKAFSATEARNGQLRAELSRLKGMAPK